MKVRSEQHLPQFTTVKRIGSILSLLIVLLLGCEQSDTKDNCDFKESDYTLFDLFIGLVVDESDSLIYFNYLGNSAGTHPVGIYKYHFEDKVFDSVLTGTPSQLIIRDIQTYGSPNSLLFSMGGDIWRLEINSRDIVQLTDIGRCYAPFHISSRNMVSYAKSTEPYSGIWILDLSSGSSSFVYPYSAYAVWRADGSMFIAEYAPDHSLHLIDSSGTLIDILIEPGRFRKIIPEGISQDGSTIIFTGVPIDLNPYKYYIYSFDMEEGFYSQLALGTDPVLSSDETTIYYNGIHPDELGIWKMTKEGCDYELIFSHEAFENFIGNIQGG